MWFKICVLVLLVGVILMPRGYPDWEGDKSGLYTEAVWASHEGESVTFGFDHNIIADGAFVSAQHAVAPGKALYITTVTFGAHGVVADDREVPQHIMVFLASPTINQYLTGQGGEGGGSLLLETPIVIPAGVTVWVIIENHAGHQCEVAAVVHGYEI